MNCDRGCRDSGSFKVVTSDVMGFRPSRRPRTCVTFRPPTSKQPEQLTGVDLQQCISIGLECWMPLFYLIAQADKYSTFDQYEK
jgi:hypothetical protein